MDDEKLVLRQRHGEARWGHHLTHLSQYSLHIHPSGRHESKRKRVRGKEKKIEVGKSMVGVRESGSKGKKTTTKKTNKLRLHMAL